MAFLDVQFPPCVALSSVGGPAYNTSIVTVRSGRESRNQNWANSRIRLTFTHNGLTQSEHDQVLAHFHIAAGTANSFRVKNWFDFELSQSNSGFVGLNAELEVGSFGFGYGVPVLQLKKRYTSGAYTRDRIVAKPVAGRMTVYRGGVAVTEGAGAGQIGFSDLTGRATFVADQSRVINSHTVGLNHVFTLASAFSPNLAPGGRIYVSGVTGTAADVLNGLSHEVTTVSTAVITTATNTAGLTASGGTAYYYPQPTETLKASGEFDLAMRFTSDEANIETIDRNPITGIIFQWSGIDLIEVRDE